MPTSSPAWATPATGSLVRSDMIYDRLDQIERYRGLQPRLYKALELLRDTDFSKIPDGTYEVEGRDLFYFVQSYDNKPDNDGPEAHKAYVDIQCVLEGREKMGVGSLPDMTEFSGKPENDIWFYHGPMDYVSLVPGKFCLVFPCDAHAPGISFTGAPEHVRKAVFKVKL